MGDNNDAVEKTKLASSSPSPSIGAVFEQADAMDKWLMTLGTLSAVADGCFMPLLLLITSNIINELGRGASSSSRFVHLIDTNSMYIVYLACGAWVAAFLEGYCWTRTGERQGSRMLTRYLKAVLRQDVEYFDHRTASTTEVVTAVSNDSLIVQDFLSEKMPNLIMNCSTLASSYLASFIMMWRLTLVAFPSMFIFITPMLICGKMLMDVALTIGVEYTKAGHIAQQAISSIRTVYSFVGEQKTMSEFSTALDVSAKLGQRQGLIKGLTIGSTGSIFVVWAFLTWYGSRLVMYHGGQGGTIFAITSNVVLAGISIGLALSNVKYLSEAGSAAARIMEMVNRVPKIDSENKEGEMLEDIAGKVEFKGVEFSYPSRPESRILNGFDLVVPPGKTVALAGASGSGKSTVIALLQRFYDPAKGEILLDGVDIRRLQLKWLRSQMGLVSQEPALFATSIKENILFGKEDASMAKVVAAAKDASIHDFISQLPQAYDTQVGERGIQLSGGQKQRIAIARAILRNPKILLLDEATSALDSQSEKVVQEALSTASIGRTTIVIAHRLSTIRNVDVIAVVEAGRVAESGSHEQLITNKNGLYASLVQLQQVKRETHEEEEVVAPQTSSPALKTSTRSLHQEHRISSLSAKPSSTKSNKESTKLADNVEKRHKQSNQIPSLWRLLVMNAPEWKQAVLGGVSATLSGAEYPFFGYVVGGAVSVYFLDDHDEMKAKIRSYCIIFLFLSIFSFVTHVGQHYWFAAMGEYVTKRVRELMLSKILSFEVSWFDLDENSTGTICSSLSKDANLVRSLVGDRLAFVLQAASAVTLGGVMSIVLSWRLALVIIAVEPLIIFAFYARRALLKNMSTKVTNAQLESGKLAVEAVSNIRTITAFSSQDRVIRLLELAHEAPRRESLKQSWIAGLALGSSQCLIGCAQALGYWYGGRLVADGKANLKTMFQVIMILNSTGRVIAQAGSMTNDLTKSTDAINSIFELLDRPTEIEPEDPAGRRPEKLAGKVDLDGVDFAYPTRPSVIVLKNFSLSIESGTSMALVGRSGSGKSTIIGLIQRFYDTLKGTVCIDGKDIKSYHLRALRRHIALVSQEPVLFASTIRENITYGVESATEAEVEAAARAASAHDLICGFKDGYETGCGDRGLQLSGGQKQRIAIARAILKNPTILLLDEATSALDNQSETVVQEALERVMLGRTCVVVAHRLSTITNSDRIAVLDKGVIVEQGTHSSLMAHGSSGAYFQLIRLQQSDSCGLTLRSSFN